MLTDPRPSKTLEVKVKRARQQSAFSSLEHTRTILVVVNVLIVAPQLRSKKKNGRFSISI